MQISVVIVTYNSENHIFECLDSVFKNNDIGRDLAVLIVDNCSRNFNVTKQTLIDNYGDTIRIIENTKNGGYGQGNNVGVKYASAPIIMIMNPDVRLVKPVFKSVIQAFDDKRVALYSFQQRNAEGKRGFSIACSSTVYPLLAIPINNICNKVGLYFSKFMYVAGACFFIRKTSLEDIGMFDENIFMYKEEDDIHYRLSKLPNVLLKYNPNISYLHLHGLYSNPKHYTDCKEEILRLKNSIYLNTKRGFTKREIIKREIIYNRLRLINALISGLISKSESKKNHIMHLKAWLNELNLTLK